VYERKDEEREGKARESLGVIEYIIMESIRWNEKE
jgi:hypothetical protein